MEAVSGLKGITKTFLAWMPIEGRGSTITLSANIPTVILNKWRHYLDQWKENSIKNYRSQIVLLTTLQNGSGKTWKCLSRGKCPPRNPSICQWVRRGDLIRNCQENRAVKNNAGDNTSSHNRAINGRNVAGSRYETRYHPKGYSELGYCGYGP